MVLRVEYFIILLFNSKLCSAIGRMLWLHENGILEKENGKVIKLRFKTNGKKIDKS